MREPGSAREALVQAQEDKTDVCGGSVGQRTGHPPEVGKEVDQVAGLQQMRKATAEKEAGLLLARKAF